LKLLCKRYEQISASFPKGSFSRGLLRGLKRECVSNTFSEVECAK
jgi:hypothetical protein